LHTVPTPSEVLVLRLFSFFSAVLAFLEGCDECLGVKESLTVVLSRLGCDWFYSPAKE
jgi:hypothetical protein